MKVQTKIFLMICLTALLFSILIILIQSEEDKKMEEIITERQIEQQKSFEHTILSVGKTLDVFSKDYTQWSDMVDFVFNRDSLWALENIEYPIETFKVNTVWIYDENFNEVYAVNNLNQFDLKTFPLNDEDLKSLFSKNLFNYFFIRKDNQLFEIRTAPIQPTEDNERITKPKGYFIAGRLWSNSLIEEIGLLTSSKISLDSINNYKPEQNEDIFTIKAALRFYDWKGNLLFNLTSTSNFSLLRKSNEVYNSQMFLGGFFLMLVLLNITVFLITAINRPLKIVYEGLEKQNPVLLEKIAKEKNEFGKLAELIIQFFSQKEQLIDEMKHRKFIESSLLKSEEKYRKIFENVQDIFYQTDLNGIITSISPSIKRYSEYGPEEVIGRKITDFYLDPIIRERLLEIINKNGEVIDFEVVVVTKTGKHITCSVNSHYLYDENKNIIGLEGSLRDITERKLHEAKILKLSWAIEQSPVSIVITNTSGIIEYVNPRFIETSGYTYDELIGQSPELIKSGLTQPDIYKEMWDTILAGNQWSGELQNRTKNGEVLWEMVFISPIKNSENIIINFLGIKEDITEKKKIIEELKTAKEKAEEMNNVKSSFLANMSHELRTPMMGILGNAEIISISTEDVEIKEMASSIFASGQRLINTLNLILDLSRVEANKENLEMEAVDVVSVLKDVVGHYSSAAWQKNLNLEFINELDEFTLNLDERLFREVLNNLINNAIKFTNIGSIKVNLIKNTDNIIIKVTDSGIGIPVESLGLIFEEFRQVSEGYGRNFEGTGLGLTITKKFVEKLGGKISVKSNLNIGSEFTVEFPIKSEN